MNLRKKSFMCLLLSIVVWMPLTSQLIAETEQGRVPMQVWSGYWWPAFRGEIRGPLAKYDRLTGAHSEAWEQEHNPSGPDVPRWEGLCHAWASSAVMEAEPQKPIHAGNEVLSVGDQKGWLAVCHSDDVANFYGDRFGDGMGTEDPADIAPDALWMVLRRHIREQRIPVVLDLEPGPEVWNYPVFAYRVDFQPVQQGSSIYHCVLQIWLADDGVPRDFVGTKQVYQRFHFQVEIQNGSVVIGTGKWLDESVKKHPDFAWFPYVVRSSNPEMNYNKVCELLGRSPVSGNMTDFPDIPTTPVSTPTDSSSEPDGESSSDGNEVPSTSLTIAELMVLLDNRKSDFILDVSPDHFDGKYTEGEMLELKVISRSSGYLYLFCTDTDGNLSVLYPQPEDSLKVTADEMFSLPVETASYQWLLTAPYGNYQIRAVVTELPLSFTGSFCPQRGTTSDSAEKRSLNIHDLAIRISPSERDEVSSKIRDKGEPSDSDILSSITGRFAQDEITLYIGPLSIKK